MSTFLKAFPFSLMFYWWVVRAVPDYVYCSSWFYPCVYAVLLAANAGLIYWGWRRRAANRPSVSAIPSGFALVLSLFVYFVLAARYGNPLYVNRAGHGEYLLGIDNGRYEWVLREYPICFSARTDFSDHASLRSSLLLLYRGRAAERLGGCHALRKSACFNRASSMFFMESLSMEKDAMLHVWFS